MDRVHFYEEHRYNQIHLVSTATTKIHQGILDVASLARRVEFGANDVATSFKLARADMMAYLRNKRRAPEDAEFDKEMSHMSFEAGFDIFVNTCKASESITKSAKDDFKLA